MRLWGSDDLLLRYPITSSSNSARNRFISTSSAALHRAIYEGDERLKGHGWPVVGVHREPTYEVASLCYEAGPGSGYAAAGRTFIQVPHPPAVI